MTRIRSDIEFVRELNGRFVSSPPPKLISEFIEGRRIMPTSTPFPGFWENHRTQYAVEIMDSMSPYSHVRYVDVMSGAQVVKSALAENVIGYYMAAMPSPILFVSATDSLLDKWVSKRLEPLINSLGIRHKMRTFSSNLKARSSGDKAKQKLFDGGCLELASAQSPASLRSDSMKILIMDEVDAAPANLQTGEGRYDTVAEARTKAFESRKKILAISTPTSCDKSLIWERYNLGDKRQFHVPCPECGKFQVLTRDGIHAEYTSGWVSNVYYECVHCKHHIQEYDKRTMIPLGKWVPQCECDPLRRSYQISSLYSPLGMYSWKSYWGDLQSSSKSSSRMRTFLNLQDGVPYKDMGKQPEPALVIRNRTGRKSGDVPKEVLFITIGIDVQRGSAKNVKNKPRLELEVLGIGEKYRTWSIEYRVFEGAVFDPFSGAWQALHDWLVNGGAKYKKGDGTVINAEKVFIDSGDGQMTPIVYSFSTRVSHTHPIKGVNSLKKSMGGQSDPLARTNTTRYRRVNIGAGQTLYDISTNYYKGKVYSNLFVEKMDSEGQKPGYCDFPVDYPKSYFDMLMAEELRSDGSFYCASGKRNEALDCRVYAMCAADVILDEGVEALRRARRDEGGSYDEISRITTRNYIDLLKAYSLYVRTGKK